MVEMGSGLVFCFVKKTKLGLKAKKQDLTPTYFGERPHAFCLKNRVSLSIVG